jgi:hypothetical protein
MGPEKRTRTILKNMKKPGKNTTYHLLSDMTEEQYDALPEEVRRVYVSTAKKIPLDPKEKLATIHKYPQYFQKVEKKPFGQNFKRFQNLKSKMEKHANQLRQLSSKVEPDQ